MGALPDQKRTPHPPLRELTTYNPTPVNEQLADAYRERLLAAAADLPFLDRTEGLVRPFETKVKNGEDFTTARFPVPVTFTADECALDPRYLVPDKTTGAILFFEDGGTVPYTAAMNLQGWLSTLTLKLWLNPQRLHGEVDEAAILNALDRALKLRMRGKMGPFNDTLASYSVLPGGPALYSAYSYETPLLYPPYKIIGMEIKTTFMLSSACFTAPMPTLKPVVC